jgi:SAM-dependent methyltransferase
MSKKDLPKGAREADEMIYLNEDRRNEVKSLFKVAGKKITDFASKQNKKNGELLDVGCATGDFLDHISTILNGYKLAGLEVSEALALEASKRMPSASIKVGNVLDKTCFDQGSFDVIFMSGVLNCLDDPDPALNTMIDWLKPKGLLLVFDMINDYPIDVVSRHRRISDARGDWESGWNYFSKRTLQIILENRNDITSISFEEFWMDKPIPKRDDPMRTWTENFLENKYQLVNGANQLINNYFLCVEKR